MSTEHQLGDERKVVSVLFADLVGFTARSEEADPEAPAHKALALDAAVVGEVFWTGALATLGGLHRARWRLGGYGRTATQLLEEAIEVLERDPPGFDLAFAYVRRAAEIVLSGRAQEGLEWCRHALPVVEQHGNVELVQRLIQMRGLARFELGDLEGQQDLREALRLCLEHGLGVETAIAYQNLAQTVQAIEGPASALEVERQSVAYASERGLAHHALWASSSTLDLLFELGEWDELLAAAGPIIEEDTERAEGSQIGTFVREAQARVHAFRGDLAEAQALVDELVPAAREIGDVQAVVPALATACAVAHLGGDLDVAVPLATELEEATRESPSFRSALLPFAVRAVAAAGRLDICEQLLVGADTSAPRNRHCVLTGHAVLAEGHGELVEAARLYHDAAAAWAGHGYVLEHALALLGAGRCLSELGRLEEARERLAEASLLLERLGARPLLQEADDLVAAAG